MTNRIYTINYSTRNASTGEVTHHRTSDLFTHELDRAYDALLTRTDLIAIDPRP